MNNAYRKQRLFWHHINNFDKPGIKTYGVDDILLAGIEFSLCDSKGEPKNIFIAANACGECRMYYENNSALGIGCLRGDGSQIFNNIIGSVLNQAADLTYNMDSYKRLPKPPKLSFVTFFAIGRKENFYKTLTYGEIHSREHPYYPLYVYLRQLLNEMRKIEIIKLQAQAERNRAKIKNCVKKIKNKKCKKSTNKKPVCK